jgi:signal transduction histidine kinase
MLQRDTDNPLSERHRRMVDEAERSCHRIVAIVGELSDIAKLDAGTVGLARQPLDLVPLIREVASGVHESRDRGVILEVRTRPDRATASGDAARLRAAFEAIFRAILRERASEGVVAVECRIVDGHSSREAVVVTADTERVQAAYDAAPAPFDEKRGGLGLALPLARRVIEGHGGRLWSPDIAEGRGIAVIALPLSE